jgi:hypothetical protein
MHKALSAEDLADAALWARGHEAAGAELPSGWQHAHPAALEAYETLRCIHTSGCVVRVREGVVIYESVKGAAEGSAPSVLQAMCSELGIVFVESHHRDAWYAQIGGKGITNWWHEREQCARAALEAFHASHAEATCSRNPGNMP